MNFRVLIRCLVLLSPLVVTSCSLLSNEGTDQLRASYGGTAEEAKLSFMKLDSRNRISPSDLVPENGVYRVGAGDMLKIEVVEVNNTETTTMVMPDGKLYYDIAPGIHAIGKTIPQLERELASALKDVYPLPIVNINAVRIRSSSYSVMGQVVTPGVYEIGKPTTVLDAVSLAGGIRSSEVASRTQNLADLRRSVLIRNGQIIPVNFEELIEKGNMRHNVYLRPNDYIYLPTKGNEKVYVLGNVRRPQAVPYSSELTFVRALASAGGPAPSTYRKGLLVIRGATTTSPHVAPVDLQSVLKGGTADFHLQPGDVIWVPKAPWQKLAEYGLAAVDSAVSTIAIQEASDNGDSNGSLNSTSSSSTSTSSGSDVQLGISTGPESGASSSL
tara:strand:- start:2123 stop:3280 length:1158 start_codon:yes stop_codon:yes gene_type:complete